MLFDSLYSLRFFPNKTPVRFPAKNAGNLRTLWASQTWVVPMAPRASSPVAFALGAPHRSGEPTLRPICDGHDASMGLEMEQQWDLKW